MKQHPNFTKFIQLWGVVFIVGIVVTLTTVDIIKQYHGFRLRSYEMRADHIANQKQIIKQEVKRVVDLITYEKEQSELLVKSNIKSRVYEAYSIAQHIYSQNKTTKSKAEIQQMILDALRPIRFADGIGYYFATRLDGVEILFADKPEMEGLNLLAVQDTRGQYIVRDMIEIVKQSNEGFYEYHWTKPHTTGNDFKKISFGKRFEPYDWFIGAGLYVDDIEEQIKDNLLSTISRIRFGKEGYVFVYKYDGTTLVTEGKIFPGTKKVWEYCTGINSEIMKAVYDRGYKAALTPGGDFFYYSANKISTLEETPKVSFAYSIPDLQWLVGAGIYLDDIDKDLALMQAKLNKEIKVKFLYVLLIALGIVTLFLFLFRRFNRRLENDINLFISFFNKAAVSNELIDRSMVQFEELDRMAENANKMLADRNQAEKERLQALRETNSIMESISDVIYVFDLKGKLVNWNKAVKDKTGYDKDELKDKIGLELIHPDDREVATDAIMETFQKGHHSAIELRLFTKGGESIPHFFSASVKKDDNGNVIGLVGAAKDISDLKQLEQQLQQAHKMESIGLMAGGVAHDLNNILSGIIGYPELLLKTLPKDSELREPLEAIHDSGQRAATVVADLLTVARGVAITREEHDLNTLIEKYLNSPECKKLKFLHPNITIRQQSGSTNSFIYCSPVHVQKCIMNLVTNGSEAITGAGTITVSTYNQYVEEKTISKHKIKAGKYVVLNVQDTGSGISNEDIEHIFEPFYTKKVMGKSGSGLGLAVVWNTMEDHDGKVIVDSDEKGTSFQLYFPVKKGAGLSQINNEYDTKIIAGDAHILIVDDEPQLRDIARRMLEDLGYSVDVVDSGESAIEFVKKKPVDLLLIDMLMEPGMNGRQTYEEITKLYPNQKAVVVSGFSKSEDVKVTLRLGAGGFIMKPYSIDQLGRVIQEVLHSRIEANQIDMKGLAELPESILRELYQAASDLDRTACRTVIEKIKQENNAMYLHLQELITSFRFDMILELLK